MPLRAFGLRASGRLAAIQTLPLARKTLQAMRAHQRKLRRRYKAENQTLRALLSSSPRHEQGRALLRRNREAQP
eukprot:CAMPEP_0172758066 /NCGR_PEP_ID=MMETSP1074-20121228/165016_1 /TAXON_ID=2916 /ORGANISM="Ceratium fusus, Strain PA161109" /LENGTH=73 /DNA_ID=CAMNT_0013591585 /DNA_START=124 /DNA_END=345 /DNA_ORIENTATION=-